MYCMLQGASLESSMQDRRYVTMDLLLFLATETTAIVWQEVASESVGLKVAQDMVS